MSDRIAEDHHKRGIVAAKERNVSTRFLDIASMGAHRGRASQTDCVVLNKSLDRIKCESEHMTDDPKQGAAVARLKSPLRFVEAFIREPLTVGSFWPSSATLSKVVAYSCDFKPHDTVVELGAGTGPITELLQERLGERGSLVMLETSASNIEVLRSRFPRCRIIHDSAENLANHLGGGKAECIISGLAWGNMLPAAQDRIFDAMLCSLATDGQFVAFGYLHAIWYPTTQRFRKRLFRSFDLVETTPIIWRNLPPALVYRCWRKAEPKS